MSVCILDISELLARHICVLLSLGAGSMLCRKPLWAATDKQVIHQVCLPKLIVPSQGFGLSLAALGKVTCIPHISLSRPQLP